MKAGGGTNRSKIRGEEGDGGFTCAVACTAWAAAMEMAPAPTVGPAGSGLKLYEESVWEEFTLYTLLEEDVLFTLQPATHTQNNNSSMTRNTCEEQYNMSEN